MRAVKNMYYAMWAKGIIDAKQGRLKKEGSWQEILIPIVMVGNLLSFTLLLFMTTLAFKLFTDYSLAEAGLEYVTKGRMRFVVFALVLPASFFGVYWLILRNGRHRHIVRVYGSVCTIKHPLHWYLVVSFLANAVLASVILLIS